MLKIRKQWHFLHKVTNMHLCDIDKLTQAYNEFWEIESDLNERIRCIKHSYDPNLDHLK